MYRSASGDHAGMHLLGADFVYAVQNGLPPGGLFSHAVRSFTEAVLRDLIYATIAGILRKTVRIQESNGERRNKNG